jgi:hypothetical protein
MVLPRARHRLEQLPGVPRVQDSEAIGPARVHRRRTDAGAIPCPYGDLFPLHLFWLSRTRRIL